MKKLQIISEKIEKTGSNYFGRGSFEIIIKQNKEKVLSWFEDLVPVQEQIRILEEDYNCDNLQKRNYVRIITKLFPTEYNQFVCLNILLRDIDSITLAFIKSNNIKTQYELLIANNRLKFPGKHKIFVDFDTYQKFITIYSNDLIIKSQDFETSETLSYESVDINIVNSMESSINDDIPKTIEEGKNTKIVEDKNESKEEITDVLPSTTDKKDKTNWMNVLLKGI